MIMYALFDFMHMCTLGFPIIITGWGGGVERECPSSVAKLCAVDCEFSSQMA